MRAAKQEEIHQGLSSLRFGGSQTEAGNLHTETCSRSNPDEIVFNGADRGFGRTEIREKVFLFAQGSPPLEK
jgi:hypothetical protein